MRVFANYGAMHPPVEGEIYLFKDGYAFFYDVNNPETTYTTRVDSIMQFGEKSPNGSSIGVYYTEK